MNEEVISQVQLSELDWDKLSAQFRDLRFILEYGPASFSEEGDSYLKSINEQFKVLSAFFSPVEEDGVVSPSPFSVYLDTVSALSEQVALIQENQILLTEKISELNDKQGEMIILSEQLNASTDSIEGSLGVLNEEGNASSTMLVEEVTGLKDVVSNIFTFSGWVVAMAVAIAATYWLYKKVIFKWINYLLKFRI